jgi:hypothetical protein
VASGTASGAGGGAGGQYAKKVVSVSAGTSYTVTVGAVAAAVITGGVVTNGNDSWFNTTGTVIAKGGAGGADATGTTGTGGTGSTTGGIGDTVFAGGSGASGVSSTQSGGGGGGAGSSGTGNSASGATAGTAKTVNGGAGGDGVSAANTQNSGSNYGGGGSGGLSSNATNRKGGDGAQGLVVLTWDIDLSITYFPFTNQPTRRLEANKRNLSAGQLSRFSYVAAPTAAAGNPYISGQIVDPQVVQSFQYPSIQEPPYIQAAAPATPALINAQLIGLVLPRRRFQYEGVAAPLSTSVPPAETITVDKWAFRSPDPVRRARRLISYGVNTAVAREEIPTLEWSIQQPILRRHRQGLREYLGGVFTTGAGPITSTPAIYIQGQSVDPQWMQGFQFDTLANPLGALTVASESITLDKWFQSGVIPQRRAVKPPDGSYPPVLQISETVTLDKWFQPGVAPRRRVVRTPQGFYVLVSQTSETATLDKWYAPETIFRRKRILVDPRMAFVKVVPFGDFITLDKWSGYQPTQYPRKKTVEGQFSFYVIPILTIPPSSLPALWRNEATISLLAADLQALGINLEDVQSVSVMAVSLVEADLVTENSALVSVITKDEQSITILYEDVREI